MQKCRCGCGNELTVGRKRLIPGHFIKFDRKTSKRCKEHLDKIHKANEVPIGTVHQGNRGYLEEKTAKGWELQHRVVMERKLNRKLRKNEVVHHKDGVRHNNDPRNLEVLTISAHRKLHTMGNAFWKGKTHTEKARRKISLARKGRKFSASHKKNLSKALKGRVLTEEHRQNLSIAMKRVRSH